MMRDKTMRTDVAYRIFESILSGLQNIAYFRSLNFT